MTTTLALVWMRRLSLSTLVAVLAMLLIGILSVMSSVSLGGLVSERMLGRDGVADSSLLLGQLGTNTELSILGFAPVISTLAATDVGGSGASTAATLHGNVASMNGLPTATGYFTWGYSESSLTNTTATFLVTAAGIYSSTITGYNGNDIVYYRFYVDSDGTAVGGQLSLLVPSGVGAFLLKSILRTIVALAILVSVIIYGSRGGGLGLLISGVLGLVAFIIINALIEIIA